MRLWHGTLLGLPYTLHTSGIIFPFVLERLSNTSGTHLHTRPWEAVGEVDAHTG